MSTFKESEPSNAVNAAAELLVSEERERPLNLQLKRYTVLRLQEVLQVEKIISGALSRALDIAASRENFTRRRNVNDSTEEGMPAVFLQRLERALPTPRTEVVGQVNVKEAQPINVTLSQREADHLNKGLHSFIAKANEDFLKEARERYLTDHPERRVTYIEVNIALVPSDTHDERTQKEWRKDLFEEAGENAIFRDMDHARTFLPAYLDFNIAIEAAGGTPDPNFFTLRK